MMNKNDIVERLALKGYTKADADIILCDVFNMITEALIDGESVRILGFGTFEVRDYVQREVTNPKNPEEKILVPAYRAPKFTSGRLLKRAIKENFIRN